MLTRRDLLKIGGAASGVFFLRGKAQPSGKKVLHKPVGEHPIICPYCATGCGMIAAAQGGKLVNLEGDPDHPINRGKLCSKGEAARGFVESPYRMTKTLYRAPGSDKWEEKPIDWMIQEIAKRIKETRDKYWIRQDDDGYVVNRTEAIAFLGGSSNGNEECYLFIKFARALGLNYIEHQARICHSSTVPALGESFGRGAMTNHPIDFKNSDVIIIEGGNPAEQHPLTFKWIMEAKDRGAKVIVVDPRFNRSASRADIFAQIRVGTDIAFMGGMINYILENKLYDEYYVKNYTNATLLVDPEFKTATDLDGLFSGYNPTPDNPNEKGVYDRSTWKYQIGEDGYAKRDMTMSDPHSVFQLLKRHYSRYTIPMVSKITGIPEAKLKQIYELYGSTGKPDRVGTITYAMGATQHSYGTQHIRSYAIVQLLLGNIGKAGGGVNALRGHSNVQGSTDHALLYHILPGYMPVPDRKFPTLQSYLEAKTPKKLLPNAPNWWENLPKYFVSQLKAWWPTVDPEISYHYLAKLGPHVGGKPDKSGDYSHHALLHAALSGVLKGMIAVGQNPAMSAANVNMARKALDSLEWLVVLDPFETETAAHWKRPGVNPADVKTEVFFIPTPVWAEKTGSITNTGLWAQWYEKAAEAPDGTVDEMYFFTKLVEELKKLYAEGGAFPEPIVNLSWPKWSEEQAVEWAKEINGYDLTTGKQVANFTKLKDDGTTACGNWLYSGSWTEEGNMMARRDSKTDHPAHIGIYPKWAWCWPVNRRIRYNRASVWFDTGQPRDEKRWVIRWNEAKQKWEGDVPDGGWKPGTVLPFIMKSDGLGHLFALSLKDGPFPEHYEPWESAVINPFGTQNDPVCKVWHFKDLDVYGDPKEYPIIATTYRLTEHWHTGMMSRNVPWLLELQPDPFVEIGDQLAKQLGIKNGEWVLVESARGAVEAVAIVTPRIQPLKIEDEKGAREVHQVGIPWHWGYMGGGARPESAGNALTPSVHDPNCFIPETKAMLVRLKKLNKPPKKIDLNFKG
ncbi:formate dehydrogenase-N subunit alpha [Oceanithermus sp.]